MSDVTRSKVIKALIWKYMERFGKEGISFIISIFLARLLMPEDFGTLAIVAVFISLANVLVQTGFNLALIQDKDAGRIEFSSVFYASLLFSIALYVLLFLTAPVIATYYRIEELSKILRVLALTLPFGAYNSIQTAAVAKKLNFKLIFTSSLLAIIVSGTVGIIMAYLGYGVWALVGQNLTSVAISCIVMHFTVKWRPELIFSWTRLLSLLSYGWKITASSIVDSIYNNAFNLIIGKKYSAQDLGFYTRGRQFPLLIGQNVSSSISAVMIPTYSAYQSERKRLKQIMRRSIMSGAFVMFPMMIGLAVVAEPFIGLVYTDKWLMSVPYMQIFAISFLFYPVNTANTQVLNGIGRSDIFLKINIQKKLLGILFLLITMRFGVLAIAVGYMISSLIGMVLNILPNKMLMNYGLKEQLKDILPSLLLSIFMGIICFLLLFLDYDYIFILIIQILTGIVIYFVGAHLLKLEAYTYLLMMFKEVISKRVIKRR